MCFRHKDNKYRMLGNIFDYICGRNHKNHSNIMHYLYRLEQAIKNNWNRTALANFRGETFTFGELAMRIERLHIFFNEIGLKKGDKVALCAKNSALWGITFFAANTYEAVLAVSFHSGLRSLRTSSMADISAVWTVTEACLTPISSYGSRAVRSGCLPCCITRWRRNRSGSIARFRERSS